MPDSDPRPAATEAEWESAETHLYSAALGFFDGCGLRLPAETVSVMVDAQLAALKHQGLTIAGAPAFGQVVVDREDLDRIGQMASFARTGLAQSATSEHRAIDVILDMVNALKGAAR